MNGNKAFSVLFVASLLIFLSGTAFAEVNVTVLPKKQSTPLTLYPHEIADYKIIVENTGNRGVENFALKVFLDNDLLLFDEETIGQAKLFRIPILESFSRAELEFQVLLNLDFAEIPKDEKFLINVEYSVSGADEFTNFSGTYLKATREPILITSALQSSLIDVGQENALEFDLLNQSNETITGINAELLLPLNTYPKGNEKIVINELQPEEMVEDNLLEFSTDQLIQEDNSIPLLVSYSDSNGSHLIRKEHEMVVKHFRTFYYFGILLLIGLIVFLVFKIKKRKKTESEKIKTAAPVEKVEEEKTETTEEKTEEPAEKK